MVCFYCTYYLQNMTTLHNLIVRISKTLTNYIPKVKYFLEQKNTAFKKVLFFSKFSILPISFLLSSEIIYGSKL